MDAVRVIAASYRPAVRLDNRDRALLGGDAGAGAALAMRVVIRAADAMGAASLIDISRAHVDGCIYVGTVSTDFVRRLADGGAQVAVPTTLNVGSVDLLHPAAFRGGSQAAALSRELMGLHVALGCSPTWTCAPYQLGDRPSFGEQIAWGESNAIVFANSVIGARTQRYGDFLDLACAITGRAPLAGLHLDGPRLGRVLVRVQLPAAAFASGAVFPLLGHLVGRIAGGDVPVIEGIPGAAEDDLKALGAAAASTGAVAMFHVAGVTPEAPTVAAACGGRPPRRTVSISISDLEAARAELTTAQHAKLGAVCLGTPHFSAPEFGRLLELLDGRAVHPQIAVYVNTSRYVLAQVTALGWRGPLDQAGIRIVTDTCTYMTPILGRVDGAVMTSSAKWAWYAPGNIGVQVIFGSIGDCVESAVGGRVRLAPLG